MLILGLEFLFDRCVAEAVGSGWSIVDYFDEQLGHYAIANPKTLMVWWAVNVPRVIAL